MNWQRSPSKIHEILGRTVNNFIIRATVVYKYVDKSGC